jgi:hypothetical protein
MSTSPTGASLPSQIRSPRAAHRLRLTLGLLTLLAALLCGGRGGRGTPAQAKESVFSCFFAGTTTDGSLFVATSPDDISGSHRIVLYGVKPTRTATAYNNYVQKMLGGYLLHVRVKKQLDDRSIPAMVGEVMIVQGNSYVNLNKAVLRDGYGTPTAEAPASYRPFAAYAQRKGLGVYAAGRPHWILPVPPKDDPATAGAVADRDRTIERLGIPNYTNRTLVPDNYSVLQYHIYITDFYLREGQVYIYRDGKLINKQAYGR